MRVLVMGQQVEILSRLIALPPNEWSICSLDKLPEPEELSSFIADFEWDALVIADYWPLVHYIATESELLLFPVIAYTSSYYLDTVRQLRNKSVYPIAMPESMEKLYDIIHTQVPILREEIHSSNRISLAQESTHELLKAVFDR